MKITDLYHRPEPTISFELFPPKSLQAEENLFTDVVPVLKTLGGAFFSVTYGAGGSTRDTTLRMATRLHHDFDVIPLTHLTCVNATKESIDEIMAEAQAAGLENILGLRGDPPKDQKSFTPVEGGFSYAVDLIRYVKEKSNFTLGAACYPEGHSECADKIRDWNYTADKVEAGAEFLISQLFYDWDDFLEMEEYLREKRNVTVPIIPGVLPFLSGAQIKRFTSLCGSKLTEAILAKLDEYGEDDESVRKYGVEVCTEVCEKALAHGSKGIHFYCLNRSASVQEVVNNLGLVHSS